MNKAPEPAAARYIVGIDLGTTNCALAYYDLQDSSREVKVLSIPQWETDQTIASAPLLPSFYYQPIKSEWRRGQLRLPWHSPDAAPDFAVGRLARLKASVLPGRVTHSAKSWLCHNLVDRRARILPWHSDEIIGEERRSPVEITAAYLSHLAHAFNQEVARGQAQSLLQQQDLTITVPASFDEASQRLTLEAARLAGFVQPNLRLLEEPQAVFYHWLARPENATALTELQGATKKESLRVLILDIGGGTSDFSLFRVQCGQGSAPGDVDILRLAVSEHLLLGGDNIDLALAHLLEKKLLPEGAKLPSRTFAQLVYEARMLKEKALELADDAQQDLSQLLTVAVTMPGSSLMAGAKTVAISIGEILELVLGGFFPVCAANTRPQRARAGLTQLGLPYAQDSAITKHIAAFAATEPVDAVLFAGGSLKPLALQKHLAAILASWQSTPLTTLANSQMDLGVALGAARYGQAINERQGVFRGGYARSLYVEATNKDLSTVLVCLVPKAYDGGAPIVIDQLDLKARLDHPVRFQLYSALDRGQDQAGKVLAMGEAQGLKALPPLVAKLDLDRTQKRPKDSLASVALSAALTETGLLRLECLAKDPELQGQSWQLDFNLRADAFERQGESQASESPETKVGSQKWQAAKTLLQYHFDKKKGAEDNAGEARNPRYLVRDLEALFGLERDAWTGPMLRGLWPYLLPGMTRRQRSLGHETSWLYLSGYCLRPGTGADLDEFRVAELWRVFQLGLAFPKEKQAEEQWWIMWRRVAGGLAREQQELLFDKVFPQLLKADGATPEMIMLLGSLERIDMNRKLRLGNQLVSQILSGKKQGLDQKTWALARVASRVPLYAGPSAIVRPSFVAAWADSLAGLGSDSAAASRLNVFYALAGRLVGDREFDLADDVRKHFLDKLRGARAAPELQKPLSEIVPVTAGDQARLFGESIPTGLVLS